MSASPKASGAAPSGASDRALTVKTDDGSFRVVTLCTTETVRGVIAAQKARGQSAELLADLVTGALLVRLTMAPDLRLQAVVRGEAARGTLVADCFPDGSSRGLLREPSGAPIRLGRGAMMQVMRSLPNGTTQQGVVDVPGDQGISGAFMAYMADSEQVTSLVGVGCVMDGDRVVHAGGWMVQLLPEHTEPPLALMYQRAQHELADTRALLSRVDGDPVRLAEEILWGMDYSPTAEHALGYACRCTKERVLASMAALGPEDLADILEKNETLFVTCDYCGTPYEVQPEALRGLVDAS